MEELGKTENVARKKNVVEWFIEPLNPDANEILAFELRKTQDVDECLDLEGDDGKNHNAYRVKYSQVTKFKKGRKKFNLEFNVWSRTGPRGIIRRWKLLDKKKINKTSKEFDRLVAQTKKNKVRRSGVNFSPSSSFSSEDIPFSPGSGPPCFRCDC